MFKLFLIMLTVTSLVPFPVLSSSKSFAEPGRYLTRTWTTREGLPQNTVYCMIQDPRGYMWLGTGNGVVRFDGQQFKTFKAPENLPDAAKVTSLLFSSAGVLWIGTYGNGVSCYHFKGAVPPIHEKLCSDSPGDNLPGNFIQAMVEDNQGNIWLGTCGKGIIRFKDNTFTAFTTRDGLSHNHITSLVKDGRGNLWMGTENGLNCLGEGKFILYTTTHGLPHHHVTALCPDKKGHLWIGTANGLSRITLTAKERDSEFFAGLKDHWIYDILTDSNDITWIASDKGLYRFGPDTLRFTLKEQNFSGPVISLYEDQQGTLWWGTAGKGFGNLYKTAFKFYTPEQGLSHAHVTAVYQDHRGDTWIGTRGGGLNRFKNGTFTVYSRKHGLSSQWVTSISGDKQGNTWIGTAHGLNRFKNENFKAFTAAEELPASFIGSLCVDKTGSLWIGTHGSGLFCYKPGENKFYSYGISRGLANPFVTVISEDMQGTLWVGTRQGLYRLQDEVFRGFTGKDGLSGDFITDIYAGPEGTLWVAAVGAGINRYQNGVFTQYKNPDYPFNTTIYRILADERHYLWLTTANGVFCVAERELNRFARDKTGIIDYDHFHEGMLKTVVFSGGTQPAGWKTTGGDLWLPTVEGITVIPAAEEIFYPPSPQQVHIEALMADDILLDLKAAAPYRFPAGTKKICCYFNAPNYRAPDLVKYKCRLQGASYDITGHLWQDRDEVRITRSHHVEYRDLPAGRYIFTVYSSAGKGAWDSRHSASLEFYIRKTFSETPWFYLLLFILGLAAAAGVFGLIKRRAKEKEMMPIWTHDEKYKTFKLTNRESKKYLKKLLEVMEKEKPFLDPEMTLPKLAERLNISKEELSQVINRELYLNFNAFLNRYRVEEAKKKLKDPKENQFVVLKIAHDVGFNSKSSFNAVFKKMTGISPSEYRKKYQSPRT